MNDWCGEHAFAITMEEQEPEPIEPVKQPIVWPPELVVYDINTDTVKPKRKYTRKEKA
jgi:hypothetical protein